MRTLPDYPSVRFSLPFPSSSPLCPPPTNPPVEQLPCSAVVGPLSSDPALDRSSPHNARVDINPFARSPRRWTMPTFIPKQKRQALACECFVLLPRHFLCDIHRHRPPVLTGSIHTKPIRSHALSLVCQCNVER
jgi:hypothetical protein